MTKNKEASRDLMLVVSLEAVTTDTMVQVVARKTVPVWIKVRSVA